MKKYYVNIYKTGRAYGGPEEGGWFYGYGEFEHTLAICPQRGQAAKLAEKIRESFKEGNTEQYEKIVAAGIALAVNQMGFGPHDGADPNGEGDDRYLMSGGQWGDESLRCMVETHKGKDFPEERPHYE